jgi:hypothetical protein
MQSGAWRLSKKTPLAQGLSNVAGPLLDQFTVLVPDTSMET